MNLIKVVMMNGFKIYLEMKINQKDLEQRKEKQNNDG